MHSRGGGVSAPSSPAQGDAGGSRGDPGGGGGGGTSMLLPYRVTHINESQHDIYVCIHVYVERRVPRERCQDELWREGHAS